MTAGELVSVVIPVFNGERFLAEAIESVESQSYENYELIVVDDGSTDGSATIVRSFPWVRYLARPRIGVSAARNVGVAAARGELIAFLDADDVMTSSRLEVQVAYLEEHPEIGCVLGHQEVFVEPGSPLPEWVLRAPALLAAPPVEGLMGTLARGSAPPMSMMVRRAVLTQVAGFDEDLELSEDLDLLFRMEEAGVELGVVESVVMRRRIHGANLTYRSDELAATLPVLIKRRLDRRRADRKEVG